MADNEKLDLVLSKLSDIAQEITGLKHEIREMKQEITELKQETKELRRDVDELKQETKELRRDVDELKQETKELRRDVDELKQETRELKRRVTSIELSIENEIRHNISIVAENHLSLMDKLNEVLRVEKEKESFLIRFNMLETDVRKIKEKIKLA